MTFPHYWLNILIRQIAAVKREMNDFHVTSTYIVLRTVFLSRLPREFLYKNYFPVIVSLTTISPTLRMFVFYLYSISQPNTINITHILHSFHSLFAHLFNIAYKTEVFEDSRRRRSSIESFIEHLLRFLNVFLRHSLHYHFYFRVVASFLFYFLPWEKKRGA